MSRWDLRPFETKNLFNPAFCAVVLMRSVKAYAAIDPRGMPFSLSLLILPLALQQDSRMVLLGYVRSYLLKAISVHPELLIGFPERVEEMMPYAFEAFGVAHQLDCFEVTTEGRLLPKARRLQATIEGSDESMACQQAAIMLGKEFARIADRVTVYTAFGIRP
ncbi:three component ABC system middle component [Pseudomonas coronafaciens]|uniref:three component ABC system middle component n=1 Tax=Pseudomonas coronafaciens TaxID=53409 RepID=UPI0006D63171|nr:three component ABC system middle component [Pseudomonas coronafaciens]